MSFDDAATLAYLAQADRHCFIVVDPRVARIRLGVAADAQAFENHILATLNGRGPHIPGSARVMDRRGKGALTVGARPLVLGPAVGWTLDDGP